MTLSLTSQTRSDLQSRFRRRYLLLTSVLAGLSLAAVAWHWSQPKSYALGIPYHQSVPILLVAALLVNGIAFYFQDQYVRNLLKRPNIVAEFRTSSFALRYYLVHLATAIVLSVVGFFPLLALLFFYWIYPVVFWLIPYQFIAGIILGRDLEQAVRSHVSRSPKEEVR